MNREFLDLYNRELRLLYETAAEFAEEYPGVAERLGGLTAERMDPMIAGLLEGSAFLASRVQLKIKHEFPEFTNNLLEQLVPHYMAPIPSAMMVKVDPPYDDPNLNEGLRIEEGAYLEARYVERERRVACRFRLSAGIALWPFEIAAAEFLPARAQMENLGIATGPEIVAGLQLSLRRRTALRPEDEPPDDQVKDKPESWFSSCRASELPVRIVTNESDAVRLYEKLFGHCRAVYFRFPGEFGASTLIRAPDGCLQQIGMENEERLMPADNRVFRGFDLLRDLFVLPQKFLGFRLTGLDRILPKVTSNQLDVIFAFDQGDQRLPSAVRAPIFALHAAPAVNLFEMQTGRVPVRTNEHEHHIVPDRGLYLEFEPHRILKVFAHFTGSAEKVEVHPLYSAPPEGMPESSVIFYTIRRLMRRRTVEERRFGKSSNYTGTDVFLSLAPPASLDDGPAIAELSIRALCSNRHLAEHLPVGQGGADFILEDNTALPVNCISGPTSPRESIVSKALGEGALTRSGTSAWRLISILSLNHLGLTGRGTENSAAALREILSLFADTADSATERRIRGVASVESRSAVRRVRQANGSAVARGLEITITFDEKAFEGSGLFLYGAVLERFFAEYAPINNFVQTVVRSTERGEVMRWPPRVGSRVQL